MSGLAIRRGKAIGFTAAAAIALSTVAGGGAAQAAKTPDSSQAATAAKAFLNGKVATSAAVAERPGFRAAADPTPIPSVCTVKSYSPNKIVLGASVVRSTFSVKATGCTVVDWVVAVFPFMNDDPESYDGMAFPGNEKIALAPRLLTNADAGKQTVLVGAIGAEDPEDTEDTYVEPAFAELPLTLQRRATFGSTFNATPEPVKKGKAITIKATLARINWNGAKTLKYVGFPKAKAVLQFRADGTTAYKNVKTVTAGSGGKISTTVKAKKSGRWRLVYPGISTTAAATSGSDAVKVK
jgi:hypothetical protein